MSDLFANYAATVLAAKPRAGGGWADFRCGIHDDGSASASINLSDGWIKCQAACCNWQGWADQYAAQVGLPAPPDKPGWADGKPVSSEEERPASAELLKEPVKSWIYRTADGEPYLMVQRRQQGDRKTYSQAKWNGESWEYSLGTNFPRILYRLPDIEDRPEVPILIVEGEKSADAAWKMGMTATTAPGGAEKANLVEDWSACAGRDVAIIADNDLPGQRHARQVAGLLIGVARSIRILTMPGVPEKGDLVDWIAAGGNAGQLRALIAAAPALVMEGAEQVNPAEPSREWIERNFCACAWDDETTARVLATYPEKAFKDPVSRRLAAAIKRILTRGQQVEAHSIAMEMRGPADLLVISDHEARNMAVLQHKDRPGAARAFREAVNWDRLADVLASEVSHLRRGPYAAAASRLFSSVSDLMAANEGAKKPRSLKTAIIDRLDEFDGDQAEEKNIRLRLFDDATGPFGPGDAVYFCGPPKTGKTGLLMQILRDAAQDGHSSLLGQLELREDQVVDREAAYLLGKPITETTSAERQYLRNGDMIEHYDKILLTPRFTDLDAYRSYVINAFAQHPEVKIWATDYSEMVQDFNARADQLAQTEAVSDFVKKTATAFEKVGLLFTQPKEEYFKDCATSNRPRLTHWKRGRKYQQDAQALFFLHNPNEFNKDFPAEYLELHLQLCRSAPATMLPLIVDRKTHVFRPWVGPLPSAADAPKPKLEPAGKARKRDFKDARYNGLAAVETEEIDFFG
jgi:hypothetical protein